MGVVFTPFTPRNQESAPFNLFDNIENMPNMRIDWPGAHHGLIVAIIQQHIWAERWTHICITQISVQNVHLIHSYVRKDILFSPIC